jgi:adenylate cyclase
LASFGELADELEPLMSYAWRRHLVGALTRIAQRRRHPTIPALARCGPSGSRIWSTSPPWSVGRPERQLAAMVQRFEQLASDIVTAHDGRVD